MPNKNLKIFIGPTEIANIGAILADAFRERGIKVTVVSIGMRPFQAGMRYDKVLAPDIRGLNKLQKVFKYLYCWLYCVLKFFPRHNAFIFLSGDTLLPFNLDLPILKLFGKKTVMWFLGSDIRHHEAVNEAARILGLRYQLGEAYKEDPESLKRKKRKIRMVEKYVDHIISGPSNAQLLTRDYIGKEMASRIYLPLDVANIRYNNVPNPRMVIVHAPTDEERKGTSYILEAVEQLKSEGYEFDFRLFRNISNIEVRKALSESDIAVDQLFAAGGGMFALEAMAAGCAVLGGNIPEVASYPKELPILHTNPDNIYQNLKMLLENPDLRRELGEKGKKYVEKYHDHRKIADDILKLIITGKAGITYYPSQEAAV